MSDRKRKKTKPNKFDRKKGGWLRSKKVISMFLSRFSSSSSPETTDQDEVLKPLYYIVGDSSSEQMEATVQSIDDQSKERNEIDDALSRQVRLNTQFYPFSNVRPDGSTESLDGTIVPEERFGKDKPAPFGSGDAANGRDKIGSIEKASNREPKRRALSKLHSSSIFVGLKSSNCRRKLRRFFKRAFVRRSNSHCKKYDSPSCSIECYIEDSSGDLATQQDTKEETLDSDDTSLPTTVLGVTFAHPVYTGDCNVLVHNANSGIETELWGKMEKLFFAEVDDCNLPPTKTVVETGLVESWGSVGSSSMYPTDEQSVEEDFFYSSSFDSDVDIPFDENFPGTVFESGRNCVMHEI
eukprot:jgi/Psemu1/39384/gm1.39384_g